MALQRWDPFSTLPELEREFGRWIGDRFPLELTGSREALSNQTSTPPVDIREDDEQIVVEAELPGVKRDDIDVRVEGNTLTIKAEKRFEDSVDEKERYHRVERFYGVYQRLFTLPDEADTDKLKAKFDNGILALTIPKRESQRPKSIKVQ